MKKKYFAPGKKKLQPQISVFIKNLIFGINRDPWGHILQEKMFPAPLPPIQATFYQFF